MANKYFENGFLAIGGKAVVKLTDITVSYSTDTDEVTSFDSNFTKEYEIGYGGWTASASGIVSDDATKPTRLSGETSLSGTTAVNAYDILEYAKTRTIYDFIVKVDTGNYQKGKVIINSMEVSGAVGSKMTYSIGLQGTSGLTKSAT